MTPDQCREARKLLGLTQDRLAVLAHTSQANISNLERGRVLRPATQATIRAALTAQGIEFTNGDVPGVRLRKSAL